MLSLTAQGFEPIQQAAVDHDYYGRKKGTPRPKVRSKRPALSAIKSWADTWGAELRRNRDGSYDALLQLDSMIAWREWQKAAKEIPGDALVAARCTVTFEELSANLPGSALSDAAMNVRVIPTRYVKAENHDALLGDIMAPSDGLLDETKAGLLVCWGAKS